MLSPIRLSDAGSVLVSADRFGVEGRDRSWNKFAEGFLAANLDALQLLDVHPSFEAGRTGINLRLRAGGTIGVVPLRSPTTHKILGGLVVEPRFGWNGIGGVLERVGWEAAPQILPMPLVPGSSRDVPAWVLAGPTLRRLEELIRQTTRGFRETSEVRQQPRGRILWPRYATRQVPRGELHRLPCVFPELGPDRLLLSYVKWGVSQVLHSLSPYLTADSISRRLGVVALALLQMLKDYPARMPDHGTLDHIQSASATGGAALLDGVQALRWLVDETGLAGLAQNDGLSWRLAMQELFEKWVAALVSAWARSAGGAARSASSGHSSFPIRWERPGAGSLNALLPDVVVTTPDTVVVVDAKYKGHFEELDDRRWWELADELKEEHRHDLHQVIAYSSLFAGRRVVSMLVYPMRAGTWRRLSAAGRSINRARLSGLDREVEICLAGVPLQPDEGATLDDLALPWQELLHEAA